MIGIQLTPMTTMLDARTSHHCEPDQTYYLWGTYTESDARKQSIHARLLSVLCIIFMVLMQDNCL